MDVTMNEQDLLDWLWEGRGELYGCHPDEELVGLSGEVGLVDGL